LDPPDLRQQVQEGVEEARVEVSPSTLDHDFHCFILRHCRSIDSIVYECIIDVDHRHETTGCRDGVALEAARISGPVPFLVVR
jgi:hypothetical protein